MKIDDSEYRTFVASMADGLSRKVFTLVDAALEQDPAIRAQLNPAFPFPRKIRIGLLPTHLLVEYVGP